MLSPSTTKPNLIVAHTSNYTIGVSNNIPWPRLTADMKFLRLITNKTALIMGRKTYESIKKPLPDRINIVLSSKKQDSTYDNLIYMDSYEKAIQYCNDNNLIIMIFGGRKVYEEVLKGSCKIFCTILDIEIKDENRVCFPKSNIELKDVSKEVNEKIRCERSEWKFENDAFCEKGINFKFYIGEK